MLQLKEIVKHYQAGNTTVEALKGIDLQFRDSEFVSILGPSGCGKTTLLNIIGGLDRYTSGDLIINNKSTKEYKDSDWDSYRNHAIGFVFQSYNLIPHLTVLGNVELALTLSGVSKAERRRRAVEVLKQVGLEDQINKKPNQMSGGQMQRVAIARALVNNPEILLADEPTGALDSETSVQIMELLKEVSKDRLVIMVTHNPELAETYSTRIVRLLDGRVTDDTDTLKKTSGEIRKESTKKTTMSIFTAMSLSFKNLMTKKGRTLMTAFAGSVGIIGIALILSLSNGIQTYINDVQEDTLSSYPLTIEEETMDISSLMMTIGGAAEEKEEHERDAVYSNPTMYELLNSLNSMETNTNNLIKFKEFLESDNEVLNESISAVQYSYNIPMNIYTKDEDGNISNTDISELMSAMMGTEEQTNQMTMMTENYMSSFSGYQIWEEMLPGTDGKLVSDLLYEQYDMVYGKWPENYNEMILILDSNNEVSDTCLFALGLKSADELKEIMEASMQGEQVDATVEKWSYEEICSREYKVILPSSQYRYDETAGIYKDIGSTDTGLDYLYSNGVELKICGIVRPNEEATASMMSGSIGYTSALTEYIIEKTNESDAVKAQMDDAETDIFTGLKFRTGEEEELPASQKAEDITEYLMSVTNTEKASIYTEIMSVPSEEYITQTVSQLMTDVTPDEMRVQMMQYALESTEMDEQTLTEYFDNMTDEELLESARQMYAVSVQEQYTQEMLTQLGRRTTDELAMGLDAELTVMSEDALTALYDNYMPPTLSDASYEENLEILGSVDLAHPSAINIYASTFAAKDKISDEIEKYNDSVAEDDKITYTDYVALLMSSITTIINAISYVLVAFVGISLVVSSIMIGIITYTSVLERTKEIGILRAIGASKRDISHVFNAETAIIGFTAGAIGILLTVLLCIPINLIVRSLTGISTLTAALPPAAGIILVAISMFLTFIAGLVPAKVAAKKDPVKALHAE